MEDDVQGTDAEVVDLVDAEVEELPPIDPEEEARAEEFERPVQAEAKWCSFGSLKD